jgi:hypothetical protein
VTTFLTLACSLVSLAWILAAFFIKLIPRGRNRITRAVFWELRPFYLPAVVVGYVLDSVADGHPVGALRIIFFAVNVANWWWYKDADTDDDDRWKRRRRKVAEKVERVGGRLAVVPAQVRS